MGANNVAELLELIKTARQTPTADEITKAFTQGSNPISGLTEYDLEAPAKLLYPVLTPLRNMIPRVSGKGGIQANWRAITGINITNTRMGLSQGNRGAAISTSTKDYVALYKGLGLDDYVNFEAQYAAEGFDDVKARAVEGLLRSAMIGEENVIAGGNTSLQLGTTPTPTLVGSTTGGTLAAQTWSVICVALGYDAYWDAAGLNNGYTGSALNLSTAVITSSITRTNMDGSSDTFGGGSAQKSANATATTTGSTSSIAATVATVRGAYGYAWFWGTAGSEVLGAVTTINSLSITAAATGTQTAASMPSADNSTNALVYDGLLTIASNSSMGAYYSAQATGTAGTGTPLTADAAAGIIEMDNAFLSFWRLLRLSPSHVLCNSQEMVNMTRKVVGGGGAPLFRFTQDMSAAGQINGGVRLDSYLNKITNSMVQITVHPTIPPGTMLFYSKELPYNLSGVGNVCQIRTRRDYYQNEWPVVKRRWEYGVYMDEVLQHYFPPSLGIITNIGNG